MPSILVVDDDASIRTMLTRALAPLGEVHAATGGLAAMKILSERAFDVILLDLHMPGLGGLQVLDIISKKEGPNRDAPVFVITADTTDEARVAALKRKALYYLPKPLSLATLRTLVQQVLARAEPKESEAPSLLQEVIKKNAGT